MRKTVDWFWIVGLAGLALAFVVWATQVASQVHPGHAATEYYRTWDGHSHPVRMRGLIGEAEADGLARQGYAYYVASYHSGRLARVVKIYDGRREWQYDYEYAPGGGLRTATIASLNGERRVLTFSR